MASRPHQNAGVPAPACAPQIARIHGTREDLRKVRLGSHSMWVTLLIAHPPYRTLVGHNVVLVLFEDRLEMRLSSTSFTVTIHYKDVRRLSYCDFRSVLFLHADVPAEGALLRPSWEGAESIVSSATGRGPIPCRTARSARHGERVYVLELDRRQQGLGKQLYGRLLSVMPVASPASPFPPQVGFGEEESSLDSLLEVIVSSASSPSLIPQVALLEATGLLEMTHEIAQGWVERWAAMQPSSVGAAAPPSHSATTADSASVSQPPRRTPPTPEASPAEPLHALTAVTKTHDTTLRGPHDLFRIYHAPCPRAWWPRPSPAPLDGVARCGEVVSFAEPSPMGPALASYGRVEIPLSVRRGAADAPSVEWGPPSADARRGPRLVPGVVSTDYRPTLLDVEYGYVTKL